MSNAAENDYKPSAGEESTADEYTSRSGQKKALCPCKMTVIPSRIPLMGRPLIQMSNWVSLHTISLCLYFDYHEILFMVELSFASFRHVKLSGC
jgi:hypothetical protein